jgi:hypothetical protein
MTTPVFPVPQPRERPATVLQARQSLSRETPDNVEKPDDVEAMPHEDEHGSVPELFVELPLSSDPDDSPEQPNDEA